MIKKIITLLFVALFVVTCTACKEKTIDKLELTEVYEYVFDAGTITELDYDYADKYFMDTYDNWGGGCSAIAKTLEDGSTIVGRNMDLNISNKAAYIIRTNCKDCYPTIGLTYTFRDISPDYEIVKNKD